MDVDKEDDEVSVEVPALVQKNPVHMGDFLPLNQYHPDSIARLQRINKNLRPPPKELF